MRESTNKTSINYIWDKFSENWFSDRAIEMMKEISKIKRAQEHKPFNVTSEKHKSFLKGSPQIIKISNKKILESTGLRISNDLKDGLLKTYKWYLNLSS